MKKQEFAQSIALQAVVWIANETDTLRHFLSATGMSELDLRARIEEPEFLAAVLDFLLMDDDWVLSFAKFAEIAPEDLVAARRVLPGGDIPHWT